MNDGGRLGEYDRDCVESNLAPIDAGTSRIAAGGTEDALLLLAVDSTLGTAKLSGHARLHFDKNQRAVVAGNDVDFRVSSTGAVIPGHNYKTRAAQVAMRQIFATAAERGVGG
jgi:hypothetical protein